MAAGCVVLLSGWSAAPSSAGPGAQDPFQRHFLKGMELADEGRCAEAIPELRKADELEPGSLRCLEPLAECLATLGDFDAAAAVFAEILYLPGGATAANLRQLNAAYHAAGEPWEAVLAAEDFLDLAGEDREAAVRGHNQLGIALVRAAPDHPERLQEAEQSFRRSLELSGGAAEGARINLAALLRHQGRDAEAQRLLAEGVRPAASAPWADLSTVLAVAGEPDRAPRALGKPPALQGPRGEASPRFEEEPAAEWEGAEDPVQHVGGDVEAPRKIRCPAPQYSREARKARIQGVVILQVIIDKEGNVHSPRVLKGLPLGLSEAAMEAMGRCRFEPATLNGEPVSVYYNLTSNFTIQ